MTIASGCSTNSGETFSAEKSELKVSYVNFSSDVPTAELIINGMSCERMCVSAVKKSIAQVPTVSIQEMVFDADKANDTLIVHFDPSKVSEMDLVKAVEELAGGDTYHVKEIRLNTDGKNSSIRKLKRSSNRKKEQVAEYKFSVPNFFEVLRKVSL